MPASYAARGVEASTTSGMGASAARGVEASTTSGMGASAARGVGPGLCRLGRVQQHSASERVGTSLLLQPCGQPAHHRPRLLLQHTCATTCTACDFHCSNFLRASAWPSTGLPGCMPVVPGVPGCGGMLPSPPPSLPPPPSPRRRSHKQQPQPGRMRRPPPLPGCRHHFHHTNTPAAAHAARAPTVAPTITAMLGPPSLPSAVPLVAPPSTEPWPGALGPPGGAVEGTGAGEGPNTSGKASGWLGSKLTPFCRRRKRGRWWWGSGHSRAAAGRATARPPLSHPRPAHLEGHHRAGRHQVTLRECQHRPHGPVAAGVGGGRQRGACSGAAGPAVLHTPGANQVPLWQLAVLHVSSQYTH